MSAVDDRAKLATIDENFAVIEFTPQGQILNANDNFIKAMGYSSSEIEGQHHRIFCEKSYAESSDYQQFWRDLESGKSNNGEFKRYKKDGSLIFLNASYSPVKDENGKVVKVIKFASDITPQKFIEAEYISKMNYVGKLFGVIEFNLDGTVITANENFLNVLGYSLEEAKGVHHSNFVTQEYANSSEYKQFWKDLNNGEFKTGEFFRIGKNGKEVWISASYNPIFDFDGNPYKVVKFATDITQAKASAIEVQRMQMMVDKSPINTMMANPNGDLIYLNHASIDTLRELEDRPGAHKVDSLIGSNIDKLHKEPAKNRAIFTNPQNLPHKTIIDYCGEKLSLSVAAVEDNEGNYLGPMVSWEVVTSEFEVMDGLTVSSEKLTQSASDLLRTANSLSAGAEETSAQANTASVASEEVNAGVQTVSSNMEEMASAIKEITRTTTESSRMSAEAMKIAENTNQIITKLGESSMDIGNVIKVISSIAQQTNLLALNATIEAARAGEAGKGFAVVANEVKELAKQTARATSEITEKIENIQSDSNSAVKAIHDISEAIEKVNQFASNIAASVEQQAATTNEITRIVTESAEGVTQITENIGQVSQAAETTGRDAQTTQESAKALGEMSEVIKGYVQKIKLN